MATPATSSASTVLNSWKEIAAYLGRGVRTVQRYERELALPVRRPHGRSHSAVIALTDELDAWVRSAPTNGWRSSRISRPAAVVAMRHSMVEAAELRDRCLFLRDAHSQAVAKLVTNLTELTEQIRLSASHVKNNGTERVRGE